MLVGRLAFDGEGVSDTLARGIEHEPDWARLPAKLSPTLRTYLERCLHKDPRQRVQAIGDVRLALEGAFDTAVSPTVAPGVVPQWRRVVLVGAAAIIAGGAIVGSLTWLAMRQPPPRVSRLQVASSGSSEVSVGYNDRDLAITPDGSKLTYVGNRGTQIFVRALDTLSPVAVYTGRPLGLFMSPDGQWIGFRDGAGTLKKVAVAGGPAVTVATLDGGRPQRSHLGTGWHHHPRKRERGDWPATRLCVEWDRWRCSHAPIPRKAKPITSGPRCCRTDAPCSSRLRR